MDFGGGEEGWVVTGGFCFNFNLQDVIVVLGKAKTPLADPSGGCLR